MNPSFRFQRRTALAGAVGVAASLAAPLVANAQSARTDARTFVLLHGAQHGGWCWSRVRTLLEAQGHRVLTPTFTGLGERRHLLSREVGLDTHIEDIVNVFASEELSGATVVAHSYAGMVAAGLTDRIAGQIERIVFLDALVPRDGESWSDLHPANVRENVVRAAQERGEGWRMPVATATAFGVTNPADVEWVNRRLTPHPFKTYGDKVKVNAEALNRIPKLYVDCTTPALGSLAGVKARVRQANWPMVSIACGHNAMVIAPRELTELVLRAA